MKRKLARPDPQMLKQVYICLHGWGYITSTFLAILTDLPRTSTGRYLDYLCETKGAVCLGGAKLPPDHYAKGKWYALSASRTFPGQFQLERRPLRLTSATDLTFNKGYTVRSNYILPYHNANSVATAAWLYGVLKEEFPKRNSFIVPEFDVRHQHKTSGYARGMQTIPDFLVVADGLARPIRVEFERTLKSRLTYRLIAAEVKRMAAPTLYVTESASIYKYLTDCFAPEAHLIQVTRILDSKMINTALTKLFIDPF